MDSSSILGQLLAQFERACRNDATIDLQGFLPPPGDPLRRAALLELIKADLEFRWRHDRGRMLEDYLQQFPELSDYQGRFPEQFAELERLACKLMFQFQTQEVHPAGPPTQTGPTPSSGAPVVLPPQFG